MVAGFLTRLQCSTALLLVMACGSPATAPEPNPPAPPAPPAGLAYQFGAKFEPPVGRGVHGMGQWALFNPKYTALLPASAQAASELIFMSLADTVRPWNPAQLAAALAQIGQSGRIPSADIALRGNQPTAAELAQLPDPYFGVDHEVANGTKWDARLLDLANLFAGYGKPVLLRIGGEFSGWWNGYHPYEFPKAFRKIVNLFRAAGADNVAFVWCYEPAAPADFAETNASGAAKWYPGRDVVDWFSIDLFAAGDVGGPATGHGGSLAYGRTLAFLDFAVAEGKPVVIAESAPAHYDLSDPSDAPLAWAEWFSPYFALMAGRSEIKWFTYINVDWTISSYYAESGWKNNDLSVNPSLAAKYQAELLKPKYLHAGELSLLKDYGWYP
ncbi:MAG: hypothetical protein ACT4PM_05430 [Gemmatimonadales bacterium]